MNNIIRVSAKLDRLLSRWEELRQQGQETTVEELTADSPELADELKRQVQQLKAMDWLDADDELQNPSRSKLAVLPPTEIRIPPLLSGRYRMDSLIAEGGFAQVWRATDLALKRAVAVKITTSECTAEAQRIAQLKHHGIVSVHDVGHEGGLCFIVFDLIDGTDLAERIENDRPSWRESLAIVIEVASHLQFAHEKGFIHRDIKPANILLDERGKPVLADFGIAITECELRHEAQTSAGTLAYMSPEQLIPGNRIDARTDIFSLGVVLYQLLTGQLPFQGKTLWELRHQILTQQPKSVSALACDLPSELDQVCMKCLSKKPDDRYQSAKELAGDLQAILQG
jgi:serine/threonine-protein kinase